MQPFYFVLKIKYSIIDFSYQKKYNKDVFRQTGVAMEQKVHAQAYSTLSLFDCIHSNSQATIEIAHINKTITEGRNFFPIRRKYSTLLKQNYYADMIEKYQNTDMYFSLNTFKHCSRKQENLYEFKALYTDIDYYKYDLTQEQVLTYLDTLVQAHKLPPPSYIVDSGRGLYVIWKITNTPKKAEMKWWHCMRTIQYHLKAYGADPACVDSARIFRLTGSIHSKTKKTVQMIGGSLATYNLNSLYKDYFAQPIPNDDDSKKGCAKEKNKPKVQRKKYLAKKNNVLYLHNQYKTYQARLQDLEKLAELRNYDLAPYKCRELMVFMMRYWHTCLHDNPKQALEKAIAFNAKMKDPLTLSEVEHTASSNQAAIRNKLYKYSNARLIELLSITEAEQYALSSIQCEKVRLLKREDERKANRRNENGLTAKQQQIANETQAVKELFEKRMKTKRIAETLKMDERKVRRLLEKIKRRL